MDKIKPSLPFVLLSLPGAFLYFNTKPALAIGAVFMMGAVSFYHLIRYRNFNEVTIKTILWAGLIVCLLLLSYLFSGQKIIDLFSYSFLRYNGSIFFCFVPLILWLFVKVDAVKQARVFFSITFLISAAICALGIIEFFIGRTAILLKDDGIGLMFVGFNYSHSATGSITAVLGITALVFVLFEKTPKTRPLYLIYLSIFYGALILTLSRGSLLAFILSAGFLLLVAKIKFKKRVLDSILILVVVSSIMIPAIGYFGRVRSVVHDRFYSSDQGRAVRVASLVTPPLTNRQETLRVLCDPRYPLDRNNTTKYRKLLIEHAVELFKNSPLIGIGFSRFDDSILSQVHFSGIKHFAYMATSGEAVSTDCNAHNSYLHFLAETGLVGTIVIIGFWVQMMIYAYRGVQIAHTDKDRMIFAVTFMSLFTLFLLGLTEHYFAAPTVMLFVSYVTGLSINRFGQIVQSSEAK